MKTLTKSRLAFLSLMVLSAYGSNVSAGASYAFSIFGIDALTIQSSTTGGATIAGGVVTTSTSDYASVRNVTDQHNDLTDASQAWVGPHPTENFYGQNINGNNSGAPGISVVPHYTNLSAGGPNGNNGSAFANFQVGSGPFTSPSTWSGPTNGGITNPPNYTVGGLPAGTPPINLKDSANPNNTSLSQPLGTFARGDVQFTTQSGGTIFNSTGLSAVNVAESLLATKGSSQASGTWTVNAAFSVDIAGNITIGGNFSDALYAWALPGGSAVASYSLDYTLVGPNGFTTLTGNLLSGTRSAQSNELANSGNFNNSFNNLGLGGYTLTLTAVEQVALGVPEPASLSLFGVGLVGLLGFGRRRRPQAG